MPSLEKILPLEIKVIVTEKDVMMANNQKVRRPALELRRVICDQDTLKAIVECAWKQQPMIVLPTFTNKIRALNSLIEKNIIRVEYDDNMQQKYYFK